MASKIFGTQGKNELNLIEEFYRYGELKKMWCWTFFSCFIGAPESTPCYTLTAHHVH
jgi:hypothetical protein